MALNKLRSLQKRNAVKLELNSFEKCFYRQKYLSRVCRESRKSFITLETFLENLEFFSLFKYSSKAHLSAPLNNIFSYY